MKPFALLCDFGLLISAGSDHSLSGISSVAVVAAAVAEHDHI